MLNRGERGVRFRLVAMAMRCHRRLVSRHPCLLKPLGLLASEAAHLQQPLGLGSHRLPPPGCPCFDLLEVEVGVVSGVS